MRTVRRTAGLMLVTLSMLASTAHAAEVSGTLTDRQGDGKTENGVHPWDLASFGLKYFDEGSIVAWFTLHDSQMGTWFSYRVEAQIGVWQEASNTCDVGSTGGVSPFFARGRRRPSTRTPSDSSSSLQVSASAVGSSPASESAPSS